MGNFGGLTAFYVRLLTSRCMPADLAPASGVTGGRGETFPQEPPMGDAGGGEDRGGVR